MALRDGGFLLAALAALAAAGCAANKPRPAETWRLGAEAAQELRDAPNAVPSSSTDSWRPSGFHRSFRARNGVDGAPRGF